MNLESLGGFISVKSRGVWYLWGVLGLRASEWLGLERFGFFGALGLYMSLGAQGSGFKVQGLGLKLSVHGIVDVGFWSCRVLEDPGESAELFSP